MNNTIKPSKIDGTITAPSSKSEMQRVTAAALLAEGTTTIIHPSKCDDAKAALNIANGLGAKITFKEDVIEIMGGLQPKQNILKCGEAGLSLRMFAPIAALCKEEITLTGEGSLLSRPINMIEQPLKDLGAKCTTSNGLLPANIKGPLIGDEIKIDGSISSQFLTGLLMALPLAKEHSVISVNNLKSTPYIDLTLSVLKKFGINISHYNHEKYYIASSQSYKARRYTIEGDWSGASFLLVAGAISGKAKVENLNINSTQADKNIIEALKMAGASVETDNNSIAVSKKNLNSFEFDSTDCPDLFPPLVVLAANCKGISKIKGVERLKHKESDRATVLKNEFAKIGIKIDIQGNEMQVHGGTIFGGEIDSHNDHRIAMAGAVTALSAEDDIGIKNAECVAKSYPDFFKDLKQIGGLVNE